MSPISSFNHLIQIISVSTADFTCNSLLMMYLDTGTLLRLIVQSLLATVSQTTLTILLNVEIRMKQSPQSNGRCPVSPLLQRATLCTCQSNGLGNWDGNGKWDLREKRRDGDWWEGVVIGAHWTGTNADRHEVEFSCHESIHFSATKNQPYSITIYYVSISIHY